MNQVVIYTDGACKGNPGPGGWGVVLQATDGTEKSSSVANWAPPTTAWK